MIAGQTAPQALAKLAHNNIKATSTELEASLHGRVTAHHRFMLRLHLDHLKAVDAAIACIDQEVDGSVEPFRVAIKMLSTIPGISSLSAEVIVAEIGIDMSRFPSEGHLISWAGLCPKNDESAGRRRSNRIKKGAPWLKTTLVQCAWAASRTKQSYLQAQYLRLRSRRGAKKAICAVAASILPAAYYMLKNGTLTRISAQTTSTTAPKANKSSVSSIASRTSDSPFRSAPWRHSQSLVSYQKGSRSSKNSAVTRTALPPAPYGSSYLPTICELDSCYPT